jgi:hypothetical protein
MLHGARALQAHVAAYWGLAGADVPGCPAPGRHVPSLRPAMLVVSGLPGPQLRHVMSCGPTGCSSLVACGCMSGLSEAATTVRVGSVLVSSCPAQRLRCWDLLPAAVASVSGARAQLLLVTDDHVTSTKYMLASGSCSGCGWWPRRPSTCPS